MLFGKKKCTQCGSSYDVVEETCPACHTRDENFENLGIPKNVIWLPIYKQILLFVFGIVLLNICGFAAEIIVTYGIKSEIDGPTYTTIINTARYLMVFVAMGLLINYDFVKFGKHFNKAKPYLLGLAGGAALIGASMLWNLLVNAFYPTTDNQNQQLVNDVITFYPVLSVFIIGIVGPLVEELTYRLGLFSFLSRSKKWIAYLVTTTVFALIHFNFMPETANELINELLNLPSYAAAGFLLCLWYDKFGLASSMVAHCFNNLFSVLVTILSQHLQF